MMKRKIETSPPLAKRQRPCSEAAALADAWKGNCSGWESSFAVPDSKLHQKVLRKLDSAIYDIDVCAALEYSGSSSAACAAVDAAGSRKAEYSFQPTAGDLASKNGINNKLKTNNEIGSISVAQAAAAGQSRQGSQGFFGNGFASQQQPAAISASLEVQRAPSQDSDTTHDHHTLLGSFNLQPPMTSEYSSCQHSPDHQVDNSSNSSRAQVWDPFVQSSTQTRALKQPSVPISRSEDETAMAAVDNLPTYQQYLQSHDPRYQSAAHVKDNDSAIGAAELSGFGVYENICLYRAAAVAAAAVSQPTTGVPAQSDTAAIKTNRECSDRLMKAATGAGSPKLLKPFFNSTAATAVEVAPPMPVTAQPAFPAPLPVWGCTAPRSKLVNITTTMTDPGRHHQQQQQQQQRLVTPDNSATARKTHRDMQHPKPTTRSASRRQLPSGSAVGAASLVKAGVQKRSTRSTRSVASSSKQLILVLQQAKVDAAADVWASGDAAAAMCSNTAATAAAGTGFAVPTAAAAALNRRKRSPKPPVTKASEIDQSASLASSSAEADGFEALMNQCDLENQADLEDVLYDGNDYDFFVAAEQPGLRVYDTTCVDEAAWAAWGAAGLAETAAEVAAEDIAAEEEAVAATIAATDYWAWEKVNDIYLLNDENPEVLVELDHQNGSNNATDDGPGVFSTAAAALAAFAASFPVR